MSGDAADPAGIVTDFLRTMESNDLERARTLLAEDVAFTGPLTRFTDRASYLEALGEFSQAVQSVEVHETITDGDRVVAHYSMHTQPFGVLPALELFVVRNGVIVSDTLVFDTFPVRPAQPS